MRDVQIGGLVSFTTIDYPGKLAAVLFLVGCPLRCVYCSNPHFLSPGDGEYDPEKIIEWLQTRVGKLEAVVFSGGEALMQGQPAIDFMRRVRDMGFKIGLHTNGFYPEILAAASDVVDWIGLDYKATPEKYKALTGHAIGYERMIQSLEIWQNTGKEFEVRITCDPRFVTPDDLLQIANDLHNRGVQTIAVQKYIPHHEENDTNKTTAQMRDAFFADDMKSKINPMFGTVVWRE